MQCTCGVSLPFIKVSTDLRCIACGKVMAWTTDDYLLHGAGGLTTEVRPSQVTMGRLVEDCMQKKGVAFIEGPVGSGKSRAYAIPALLSGKRTIFSTAKKALQQQLTGHDLPYICEKMHLAVPFASIKGKSNYACRVNIPDIPEKEQASFRTWLDATEFGDIAEYPARRPFFWSSVTAEDCVGSRCTHARSKQCGYWKAKLLAKSAQLLVVNHSLLAYDLRFGPFKLLGEYTNLVIDEAHQAAASIRGAFSQVLSSHNIKHLIRQIDNAGISVGVEKKLEEAWVTMFERVRTLEGEIPKNPFGSPGDDAIEYLEEVCKYVNNELRTEGAKTEEADGDFESDNEPLIGGVPSDWQYLAQLLKVQRAAERPLAALREAKEPTPNTCIFATTTEKKTKLITVAPIEVGPMVGVKLQSIPSLVITSATIAISGSFDDVRRQLGLSGPLLVPGTAQPRAVFEQVLETPFDFAKQALLYSPKHLPLPVSATAPEDMREKYFSAMTAEIFRLLRASGGNAFVLFSSVADMKEIHARLLEEELDVPLILQGDDAASALKTFHATPHSAILGVKSFWEGVDVVGDKLHLVIITKLPFPCPTEPVVQARSRNLRNTALQRGLDERQAESQVFQSIMIPAMLTDLRQGAGRLIRSKTDKGVLAILDSRIWTGSSRFLPKPEAKSYVGYGGAAVGALGYSQRTSDFNLVDKYLRMLRSMNP